MYAWQCASKTTQVTLLLHVANLRLLWMLICLLTFEKLARTSSSSRSITMVQQKSTQKSIRNIRGMDVHMALPKMTQNGDICMAVCKQDRA